MDFSLVVNPHTAEGEHATWKRRRVIVNGGGQLGNGDEFHDDAGVGFLQSVKITK